MKVKKANPNNLEHIRMYNHFCLMNNITPNVAYALEKERTGRFIENRYIKTLYFFTEKKEKITESCTVSIEKDLKKATLSISEKQVPSKNEDIFHLVTDCIDYLFQIEPVEEVFIQMKEMEIDVPLQAYGYDVLSLGKDEKGVSLYSVEKENIKEERKQRV